MGSKRTEGRHKKEINKSKGVQEEYWTTVIEAQIKQGKSI